MNLLAVEIGGRLDRRRDFDADLRRFVLRLLPAELIFDLRLHFGERLGGRVTLIEQLDDVVAELGLHEAADLVLLQRPRR